MARYDKVRRKNRERDKQIRRFRKAHPDMAFQEIADEFGLKSRQHAFYIINGKAKVKLLA